MSILTRLLLINSFISYRNYCFSYESCCHFPLTIKNIVLTESNYTNWEIDTVLMLGLLDLDLTLLEPKEDAP